MNSKTSILLSLVIKSLILFINGKTFILPSLVIKSLILLINILFLPLTRWIIYTHNQSNSTIFVNLFCALLIIIISFVLLIDVVFMAWGGYRYMTASDFRSNEEGKRLVINVACQLLWPIFISIILINPNSPLSKSILDLVTNLLLIQIDEEQKCLLCDTRAEWEQLDLNLQQIKRKELVFILFLYWGKFISWYNYENKRPRA
jgi:hypothetical protein